MANNRMFVVHLPTGLAAYLGKRGAWGWYNGKPEEIGQSVAQLFEVLEEMDDSYAGKQDDFAIAMDDVSDASMTIGAWHRGPDRADKLVQLIITQKGKSAAIDLMTLKLKKEIALAKLTPEDRKLLGL